MLNLSNLFKRLKVNTRRVLNLIRKLFSKKINLELIDFYDFLNQKDFFYRSDICIKGENILIPPSKILSKIGSQENAYLTDEFTQNEMDVRICVIKNARIYGDIDLIRCKNKCFLYDHFNINVNISPDEIKDNISISKSSKIVKIYAKNMIHKKNVKNIIYL